ncbi:MAG: membrane protein insertase YidC [Desulfobacterota bacterium]|nr:membrane protein insertase YidC [Thermodesulfobacteriota bacterium]
MIDKRALLAIILTFLVIFGWGIIQTKLFPPVKPPQEEKKGEVVPQPKKEMKASKEEKPLPKPKVIPKKEIVIETRNFTATLTNADARLKHFKLKHYRDRIEESPITLQLTKFVKGLFGGKVQEPEKPKPLDLVNTSEEEGLPLGLIVQPTIDPFGWEVDKDGIQLLKPGEKGEVTFTQELGNGLKLLKKFIFSSEGDHIDIKIEVQNQTKNEMMAQLGIEWIGKVELEKFADHENKDYGLKYLFMKDQRIEKKDLGGTGSGGCTPGCGAPKRSLEPFEVADQGQIRWFAFAGEYFTALIVPTPSENNIQLNIKGGEKNILKAQLTSPPFSIQSQGTVSRSFRLYLGPKLTDPLKELGVGAEGLVDFGFFTVIAKPLLWFLKLTHQVTKNFGIDIIILSILLKILFLPLTQISMKSMREMQKVQPEMNRLREQYKNDKARLQHEIMLLYKRRRINPMSGCLPMLIQIPVFIALYNALHNSIELRHAAFILWIRDLSAKDPIYITPILMGATMVIQQKMTPTAADPAQARLFMLMPIMFTFLFLNFPSGLVLYWMVTNILSIAHQYIVNRKW